MSTNTWTPGEELKKALPAAEDLDLQPLLAIGNSEDIENRIMQLDQPLVEVLTPLMTQDEAYWNKAAGMLSSEELWQLIRLFTVAEEKHGQLFAGNASSVIALNKLLKQRKTPLSREQLLWIKAHSTNRYLPNGSIL